MKNDNQFFTTEIATAYWLHSMGVENYTIREDLTVDVKGDVYIADKNLKFIPVQFSEVEGDFWCQKNQLTTLEGCPKTVSLGFYCYNNNLTTLKGCPINIEENFACDDNELKSLKFTPKKVNGNYYCDNNQLTTLKDLSIQIGKDFHCYDNPITDFNYLDFEVKGNICFTPTKDMEYLESHKDKEGDIIINFNDFKKLQALKKLNEKLTKELPKNIINIKQKI